MDDLIEFLGTQFDKRETAAKAVLAENAAARDRGSASTLWGEEDARARQDLRDLRSKRLILAEHNPFAWSGTGEKRFCSTCTEQSYDPHNPLWRIVAPCDTVKFLAQPYDDEDGYKEDWRP